MSTPIQTPTTTYTWNEVTNKLTEYKMSNGKQLAPSSISNYIKFAQITLKDAGLNITNFLLAEVSEKFDTIISSMKIKYTINTVKSRVGSLTTIMRALNAPQDVVAKGIQTVNDINIGVIKGTSSEREKLWYPWPDVRKILGKQVLKKSKIGPVALLMMSGYTLRPLDLTDTFFVPTNGKNHLNLLTGEWKIVSSKKPRIINVDKSTLDSLKLLIPVGQNSLVPFKNLYRVMRESDEIGISPTEVRRSFSEWLNTDSGLTTEEANKWACAIGHTLKTSVTQYTQSRTKKTDDLKEFIANEIKQAMSEALLDIKQTIHDEFKVIIDMLNSMKQ